jgi:hypothetical protein
VLDKELLITPEKLIALRKHLQIRVEHRKKARDLILPNEKSSFVAKMKNIFNTYQ